MGKPFLDKKGFPLPFPKNFFNKKGAEGTGRAPTTKRAPKCGGMRRGSCRGIANMGAADASRLFAY